MTEQDSTNNSENKVRVMSPRGFLAKSNSRKVVENKQAFLMAYRTWLSTPEKLRQLTAPIFVKWESNSFTLDEAFSALQQAVVDYIFLSELDNLKENQEKKAQAAIKKQEEETRKRMRHHEQNANLLLGWRLSIISRMRFKPALITRARKRN